jgi:Ca2+-binding EF-hand superfamily protein
MRWIPVFASLLVATAAVAQSGGWQSGARPGPHSVDANKDGIVTRDEAKTYPRLSADFDSADTNKDGQLDAAEMNAHRERMRIEMRARADERWKAADTDGDGAISRAEAEASMPRMAEGFKSFDADGDGKVSRDEMHNFRMKKKKKRD